MADQHKDQHSVLSNLGHSDDDSLSALEDDLRDLYGVQAEIEPNGSHNEFVCRKAAESKAAQRAMQANPL